MEEATIIGVDLAKNVFQVHGASLTGSGVSQEAVAGQFRNSWRSSRPHRS